MSVNSILYGVEKPSKQRKFILNIILVIIILWGYGWWVDFVPNQEWSNLSTYISIALTAVFTIIYYWALATGRTHFNENVSNFKKAIALLFLPVIIFAALWISITHGIADIVTKAIGEHTLLNTTLAKQSKSNGKGCTFRLIGSAIKEALPSYLCINETAYNSFPVNGTYVLTIQESDLGFHVYKVDIAYSR